MSLNLKNRKQFNRRFAILHKSKGLQEISRSPLLLYRVLTRQRKQSWLYVTVLFYRCLELITIVFNQFVGNFTPGILDVDSFNCGQLLNYLFVLTVEYRGSE